MSEVPPNPPEQPSGVPPKYEQPTVGLDYSQPPQQYAGYARPHLFFGSADKLQALADGYYGMNLAFVLTLVLAIGARMGAAALFADNPLLLIVLGIVVPMIIVAAITYPYNKKIAYGANWKPGMEILASVLMGLNLLCCGIVGFIVMQNIAASQMKKYGLRGSSFLGFRKKDVNAAIEYLRANPSASPGQAPPPPGGRFQP